MSAGPWWHAFGRVRSIPVSGEPPAAVWQLTVISPSPMSPEEVRGQLPPRAADSWGAYLTSWDHEPTDTEKDEVTPEPFRDDPTDPNRGPHA